MNSERRFAVYADINCPFCYALNERFEVLGLSALVEWRPIQHAPSISSGHCTFDSLCDLTSEVSEVRRRSPSSEIAIPPVRPNSAAASELITEAWLIDPLRAARLRLLIYRALWRDGQDVSHSKVLLSLLQESGFDSLSITRRSQACLSRWQHEWEQGDFDRNIPVTIDSDRQRVVGFPLQEELDAFLSGGSATPGSDHSACCAMRPRQRLLLVENDLPAIQQFFSLMKYHDVVVVNSEDALENHIQQGGMDLIVINLDAIEKDGAAMSRIISQSPLARGVPIIALASSSDSGEEVTLFEAGASDYIARPVHEKVLQARLNLHLERKRSKDLLERMARYDELTDVFNRREFNVSLQGEWQRALRNGTSLAILMMDVDLFKKYNDFYGHGMGDRCLRQVAAILQASLIRPGDRLARYGGEEFVMLLPETDVQGAIQVAERCCRSIADAAIPHDASDVADHVTISVGLCARSGDKGYSAEQLLEAADRALYNAKGAGRNRVSAITASAEPDQGPLSPVSKVTLEQ